MEKNATEILREIEAEIASLKDRIQALESRLTEYQELAEEKEVEVELEPELEPQPAESAPVDFTDMEIGIVEDPSEDLPVEDLPEPEPQPEPVAIPELDPELERMPWHVDKPGMSVKNIRSGISLYDRALFIGSLFKEDFALYDRTIADLNTMDNLKQAVAYIVEHFPDWNLRSDIVYNFIMAIRKKLG